MNNKLLTEIRSSCVYTREMYSKEKEYVLNTVAYYDNEQFVAIPRYPHILIGDKGTIYDIYRRMRLYAVENNYGFLSIDTFDLKHGRVCRCFIHRLIMMAFRPIPNDDNMQVVHIDGNKRNNHLSNLKWEKCVETVDERMTSGMTTASSLFTMTQVRALCEQLNNGLRIKEAILAAGLEYNHPTKDMASRLCRGLLYPELLKEYPNIASTNRGKPTSDKQIEMICQLLIQGLTDSQVNKELFRQGGGYVSIAFIDKIRYGMVDEPSWIRIINQYPNIPRPGLVRTREVLSDEVVHQICRMILNGTTIDELRDFVPGGNNKSRDTFRHFINYLTRNAIKSYLHITSQYFRPGGPVPTLSRV